MASSTRWRYTSPRVITGSQRGRSQRLFGELVTRNYFSTLELRPAKGRFFLPRRQHAGGEPGCRMNYGTWQDRFFGGADDIIGKTLRINNVVFTVVGVAPPNSLG